MERMLKTKLSNILRTEANKTMEEEKDINVKVSKMNDLFNLKNILDNYDDLQPLLTEYFNKKAEEEKWRKETNETDRQ